MLGMSLQKKVHLFSHILLRALSQRNRNQRMISIPLPPKNVIFEINIRVLLRPWH